MRDFSKYIAGINYKIANYILYKVRLVKLVEFQND